MEKKKITGIVIGETLYSESSKILTLYTKKLGLLSVISKGCRRLKSPLRGVSNKLSYGEFIIAYSTKGLSTLISVDVKNSFRKIMSDINSISYATYLLDLTNQVAKQNDEENIFDLLIQGLTKIEEGIDAEAICLILEVKYLKYLGIDISIDCCSKCGCRKNIVTVNSSAGGYLCKSCYQNETLVDEKTIKVLRLFYYVDIGSISKLELGNQTRKELSQFLEDYYDQYSGLYLKSRHFLKVLNPK